MIPIEKIDPKADEFSEEELETMAEIVLKAKAIQDDTMLMALVERHMRKKKRAIESLEDLRRVQAEKNTR